MRQFETDYAGAWKGHCKSRESAIMAAMRHVVTDGYVRATITDKVSGEVVARVRVSADRTSAHVEVIKPLRNINGSGK